jgi:D-glycero-D-manno-heptose 1,7-bisphosphate phosphatase
MSEEIRGPRGAAIQYVFLDRDGVINRKLPEGKYVTRWEEFELLPGVAGAIAALNRHGRRVILVTNQRGVALGLMTEEEVEDIHDRLRAELAREVARLDAIYYCPHDRDECNCRKPRTGMLEAAFRDFPGAGPENSILIGDSLSDMECGHAAGMATILIEDLTKPETADRERCAAAAKSVADASAKTLNDAVRMLL